jgi:pimeloyl-ACP methyl ester carboxylesterase
MATYEDGRDEEYLRRLKRTIDDFAARYDANPNGDHKTIFLFPGGLGSHLIRANKTAQNGPPFSYNTIWLDCSIAVGAARQLAMQGDVDLSKHYVLPDGCIDFIFLQPYEGFIQWCQKNWLDLFVFGWDWRRTTENNATFFLTKFLPMFEKCVCHLDPPPLNNFWLIGHSFGGMVVKKIVNRSNDPYVQKMQGAITVATPFYGYGGHLHRFFKGVSLLNWSEEPHGAARITEIASSLPAGYELLFLDATTYNANQVAFSKDKDGYNLKDYPIKDAKDATIWADPYVPVSGANGTVRYITTHGFNCNLLDDGRKALHELSKALLPPHRQKILQHSWRSEERRQSSKYSSNPVLTPTKTTIQ